MDSSTPKFYTAWFSPWAHRVWIALVAKNVKFEYIEQNPYNKTPEWMSISPTGLVPVIVHKGRSIYESSICVEYIDEAFVSDVSLMPNDPYQRAYARIWGKFVEERVLSHILASVLRPSEKERHEAQRKFLTELNQLIQAMSPNTAFFQQDDIGYVDVLLAPLCICWEMLQGMAELGFPDFPDSPRFRKWFEAVSSHPAVKATATDQLALTKEWKLYVEKKRNEGQTTNSSTVAK